MRYINGDAREDGCIFCERLEAANDVESLILFRGQHTFTIMNLYPYNTGHIMLVPNAHASDPAQLSMEALHEMGETLPVLTTALRTVLNCSGFNVGLNIGAVAGAGVAGHLHQHIVPRWLGDANFMPILASTMVIPETIPVTYAKIRAEIQREMSSVDATSFVLIDRVRSLVLLRQGALPRVDLVADQPVWQSIIEAVPREIKWFELAGWAGADVAAPIDDSSIVLTLRGEIGPDLSTGWEAFRLDSPVLDAGTRSVLERAQAQIAPGSSTG
ncbi:MAG TPA: HIT domain-containing protein [Thermomicrobiales bacterium]|nr:HIT domain-containing protein [Thermomicrobiales bacterium]